MTATDADVQTAQTRNGASVRSEATSGGETPIVNNVTALDFLTLQRRELMQRVDEIDRALASNEVVLRAISLNVPQREKPKPVLMLGRPAPPVSTKVTAVSRYKRNSKPYSAPRLMTGYWMVNRLHRGRVGCEHDYEFIGDNSDRMACQKCGGRISYVRSHTRGLRSLALKNVTES